MAPPPDRDPDDDDPTPRHRPRRIQTGEDRDLAARRARSHPLEVPILPPQRSAAPRDIDTGDITSPFDLLERDPDDEVQAVVERSPRNGGDPATYADVVKLAVALTRERSGNRQREHDAEEVLRAPRVAAKSSRRYLIATVIAAAAGIASPIADRIARSADRPAAAGGDAARMQQLEQQLQHEIDRLDAELRAVRDQLGRRSERAPLAPAGVSSAFTVTTKGTP